MANPNRLSQFWQELKRRNVVRVITVYAGAAFVIIELINNITEPLHLPEWTPTLVIVLLAIGFPIVIIFSWVYDIHPDGGMVKTEPVDKVKAEQTSKSSNSWKIASYISFVVIVGLIALNIFGRRGQVKIDESLAKSVAVLIFNNYSGDPGQDIMCEGLTDEIINNLFKIASFDEVRSLNSVKQFQDSVLGTKEIAQKLHVNYVLAGSSKRMGNEKIITAQLIEAKGDRVIWSDDYPIPYREIMDIPGDIALQIANNLKAFISKDVQKSIDRRSTDNLEVYEIGKQIVPLYNQAVNENDPTNFDKITELANNAIALDPDYADAYAYLGMMKLFNGNYAGDKEMKSVAWDAKDYFEKAIERDSYNLMANCGLALISYWVEWDYIELYDFGLKFPDFLSSNVSYMSGYTMFKTAMGNFKEAVSIPENDYFSENVAKAYILLGNEERARELLKGAAVEQGYYLNVGESFIWLQEFDTALYYLESALTSKLPLINIPRYQADLALACYKTNQNERARKIIGALMERSDTTSVGSPAYFTGWYYGWIGEPDSAFYWLEIAVENKSPEIPWLKVDPAFNSLKEDPHYRNLYERTGHKDYDDYMASRNQ